jgi:hypothetical protein
MHPDVRRDISRISVSLIMCTGLYSAQSVAYCSSGSIALQYPNAAPPPHRTSAKITLGEMRADGVRGLLIYCSDFRCSHWTAISGNRWPDDVRLSDLEPRFTCQACGIRGADVRPDFNWDRKHLSHTRQSDEACCVG